MNIWEVSSVDERKYVKTALTIAGSDSGGGAGIEADLKTFSAFGVHGLVAITSVTAQNTQEVRAIYDVSPEVVAKQIEAVADDIGVDAAKTGMLSSAEIIKAVAKTVEKYEFPLVVDPVMIAKSGAPLLREDAVDALIEYVIPLAALVTPNKPEAEKLSGIKIETLEDAKKAAKIIVEELGAKAAIVKGGHLNLSEAVDVLYYDGKFREYRAPFVEGCTHGTGCSFSAAITANLAKGKRLEEAIKVAKEFITMGIFYGARIGKGHCPVNQNAWIEIPAEKWRVYESLTKAVRELERIGDRILPHVPEVGMNFVYALPRLYARTPKDVAGVKGRIVRFGNTVKAVGSVEFGASGYLARAVLKFMGFYPEIRSALNLRYSEELIKKAQKNGFRISFCDRRGELEKIKVKEEATIPRDIETAIERLSERPDIICPLGNWEGKALILIFGESPEDVLRKLKIIL
ncbi:bifunctional hydroxymethylpyrimidine kinase/phosphomethylpyrimidine kinase [Thermococcus sp. SY098]|uniref:bifunctional hydroxymethylpyrimidine kinase/phosphomethylpyrimidine kinase n=1 Tax=Thermococcus sp. SY098 TaxID=3111325 RepID=UPI002D79D104|nr:bifunctional hydroxymethylpyrimidine kinase/phosphomethylpyrimidine kinase [Thermococcus sp. SY098]WRS52720.1 bifunctional hydroxymethylpyrimidine kinase/phosphomethylpyrimidine kinase [Thermococcus sp. SY098]